jgi:threonine/homoserine/homoserine lactone efflux protein
MTFSFFLKGLIIGLAMSALVGPIGILCIRRTITGGRIFGLVSGLGVATADAIYGGIAGYGLIFISNFLINQQTWFRLGGGIFLFCLGLRTLLARPVAKEPTAQGKGLIGAFISMFFLTLTHPMTILIFVAIFAGLGLGAVGGNRLSISILVLGVFMGSTLWWFILSSVVGAFRTKFNLQGLLWVNRISGLVIMGFGLIALLSLIK